MMRGTGVLLVAATLPSAFGLVASSPLSLRPPASFASSPAAAPRVVTMGLADRISLPKGLTKSFKVGEPKKPPASMKRALSFPGKRASAAAAPAATKAAMPAFSMPKLDASSLPDAALPAFSLPSLKEEAAAPEPPVVDEPEFEMEAVEPQDQSLGELVVGAVQMLAQLLLAKIQLAIMKQVDKVMAVPQTLLGKAKKMVFMAPFYARAALELQLEDAKLRYEQTVTEVTRMVDDAPRYYAEQARLAQAAAQLQAEEAVAKLVAAPEEFVNSVAAEVKGQLDAAQAKSTSMLEQAKGTVSSLKQ